MPYGMVVGAIGLVHASGMLVGMSIHSTKNNWNIGETLLPSKSFNHQTISQKKKQEEDCRHFV
jgi:hypothetical protein